MLIKIIQPDFTHTDERGTLTQLVRAGYRQINVVSSKAGSVRGDHYHKNNTEAFFVISGSFTLQAKKDSECYEYIFKKGDMFEIPPYVSHHFNYIEDTILISMYSKGVEMADASEGGSKKDIHTYNI
jgi:dTDP-4-dehydrorhamnose 3,5-epimerase-like enzyme